MISLVEEAVWYVYLLVDSRNGSVFYVGKGKGRRCYTHAYRAKTWISRNRVGRCNKKLFNKIGSIWKHGGHICYVFVQKNLIEDAAFVIEKEMIAHYGLDNLCNLTEGGEGGKRNAEVVAQIQVKHEQWRASEAGEAYFAELSRSRTGSGNPMWGRKEDEEHKQARMANMLSKQRWNKGLKNDPRCKGPTGKPAHNRLACALVNANSGDRVEANSLAELASLSGVSLSTINRLRAGTILASRLGWSLECLDSKM